jgi:hypothetical protein
MKQLACILFIFISAFLADCGQIHATANIMSGIDQSFSLIEPTNLCCASSCLLTNGAPGVFVVMCFPDSGCGIYQLTGTNPPLVYIGPYRDCSHIVCVTNYTFSTNITTSTQYFANVTGFSVPNAVGTYGGSDNPIPAYYGPNSYYMGISGVSGQLFTIGLAPFNASGWTVIFSPSIAFPFPVAGTTITGSGMTAVFNNTITFNTNITTMTNLVCN